MSRMTPLFLTLCLVGQPATHEARNPLFKELLDPGLPVGPNLLAKFPPPCNMALRCIAS